MTKAEQVRQQAEEEIARWSDPRFAGVDVVGRPTGRDYASSKVGNHEGTDPRFAPIDSRGSFKSLRDAVTQLARDPEVRERVARETGNEGELEALAEDDAVNEVHKFRAKNPSYLPTDTNWRCMAQCMAFNYLGWQDAHEIDPDDCYNALLARGLWREPNLTAVFETLYAAGSLDVAGNEPKALSESQQLTVISLAKAGRVQEAIGQYLSYAFREADSVWADSTDFLADPKTVAARNDAVRFVWLHSRPAACDSPEWRKFQRQFFASKPVLSVADLDAAYAAFTRQERDALRQSVLSQVTEPTAPEEIDSLSDGEIDRLYHGTLREYAKSSRGPGVLI